MSATGTAPGSCGYCLTELSDEPVRTCDACKTSYHTECWDEYGGCTVFGCTKWMQRQMIASTAQTFAPPVTITSAPTQPAAQTAAEPAAQPAVQSDAQEPAPAAQPAIAVGANGLPVSGWHPDPLRRFEHRYWNGTSWTALVSNNGVPTSDEHGIRPTPLPAPGGDSRATAEWYPDPTTRHIYRYWGGRRWTDRVADNGIETSDPATMEPT